MYSKKIIARSSVSTSFEPVLGSWVPGLVEIENEDPNIPVRLRMKDTEPSPTPEEINRLGKRNFNAQLQLEDNSSGQDMGAWHAATDDLDLPDPGTTIAAKSWLYKSDLTIATRVTTAFAQPAPSGTVNLDVLDSSGFVVNDEVFVEGAGFFLITAIPDATHITGDHTGESGAIVTAAA